MTVIRKTMQLPGRSLIAAFALVFQFASMSHEIKAQTLGSYDVDSNSRSRTRRSSKALVQLRVVRGFAPTPSRIVFSIAWYSRIACKAIQSIRPCRLPNQTYRASLRKFKNVLRLQRSRPPSPPSSPRSCYPPRRNDFTILA